MSNSASSSVGVRVSHSTTPCRHWRCDALASLKTDSIQRQSASPPSSDSSQPRGILYRCPAAYRFRRTSCRECLSLKQELQRVHCSIPLAFDKSARLRREQVNHVILEDSRSRCCRFQMPSLGAVQTGMPKAEVPYRVVGSYASFHVPDWSRQGYPEHRWHSADRADEAYKSS